MGNKKLLITGFEPFGGQSINPSWEAVSRLGDRIGEVDVVKIKIPVEFNNGAARVIEKAEEISPDVIICVGEAGGRDKVCLEKVAINIRNASIPDNAGVKATDELIAESGREAFFTTAFDMTVVDAVKDKGIPCAMSYHAGAYVCNDVYYNLLSRYHDTDTKVGFIHVPRLPQQVTGDAPCMALDMISDALTTVIECL